MAALDRFEGFWRGRREEFVNSKTGFGWFFAKGPTSGNL